MSNKVKSNYYDYFFYFGDDLGSFPVYEILVNETV